MLSVLLSSSISRLSGAFNRKTDDKVPSNFLLDTCLSKLPSKKAFDSCMYVIPPAHDNDNDGDNGYDNDNKH